MYNDVTKFGTTYAENIKFGINVEKRFARYMQEEYQYSYFDPAEYMEEKNTGPGIETPTGKIPTPDILFMKNGERFWVDVKAKVGLTWHRISQTYQTGIDKNSFKHYQTVQEMTGIEVRIVHVVAGWAVKDSEATEPMILMGSLDALAESVHHDDKIHGSKVLFWTTAAFEKIGTRYDARHILFGISRDPNVLDLF